MPLFSSVRASKGELSDDHALHGARTNLGVKLANLDVLEPLALLFREMSKRSPRERSGLSTTHCAEFECSVPPSKFEKDGLDPIDLDRKCDLTILLVPASVNSSPQCGAAKKDIFDDRSAHRIG